MLKHKEVSIKVEDSKIRQHYSLKLLEKPLHLCYYIDMRYSLVENSKEKS